jgi:hypothetical protein
MRILRILFTTLVLCLPVSAFAADAADLLRDLHRPSPGAAIAVNNVNLTVGHLHLTLASGSAAKLAAAGEPVGFFFKGNGRIEYTAEATEMPIVTRNVKTDSHATLAGSTITADVVEALVILAGTAVPDLGSGAASAPLGDALNAHQEVFSHARVEPGWHLIAAQKLGLPGAAAYMEIVTSKDTLVYEYDSAGEQQESLTSVHPWKSYV